MKEIVRNNPGFVPVCFVFNVVSLNFDENEPARFFELLKTDPVFGVEPRFLERNDFRVGARSVKREMLRLDWHDHRILKRILKSFTVSVRNQTFKKSSSDFLATRVGCWTEVISTIVWDYV
jgi:hypothetical protein